MSFQNGKNLWGNLDKNSGKNNKVCQGNVGLFGSTTTLGSNSGATSLPSNRSNSSYELGKCSTDSCYSAGAPGRGPNSIIGLGMESKKYNGTSGESSGPLGQCGSGTHINVGNMVEKVFMEEIGKMSNTMQNQN